MKVASAAGIIFVVIALAFFFSIPHTHDTIPKATSTTATTTPLVTLDDSYSDGTHSITGSLEAPTPCTDVSADATVIAGASSTPDTIDLDISMPSDEGICLQQPTAESFSASAEADKGATISVTVNGLAASTTSD